jgi:hypothetical protein
MATQRLHIMRLLISRGINDDTEYVLETVACCSLKGVEGSLESESVGPDYDYIDEEVDDDTEEVPRGMSCLWMI